MFKFYTIPTIDIIDKLIGEQATIKISSAFTLNDPFELKFNMDLEPLAEEHKELFIKNNPGSTEKDFKDWQRHVLEGDNYTWYLEQQQRERIAMNIALCSFTETNKNNLMWSHYTNNHKGICVEYKPEMFEYLNNLQNFLVFWKVIYSKKPPTVKTLETLTSKVEKMMFNKQIEWKYEKEHRVVFQSDKDTEFIPIDRKFIKSVYIGSRADTEIDNKILAVCNNTHIDIYYGITLGKSYDVNFEKHKDRTIYTRAFYG
ncbi:DUF2971 domain-containing protein [Cyclobacterium salsum]|uniref:DUF2971 domain-containing protein n=1 Tax=Cyclobacterium salsum TaxID=2666329 RepID=UPI001391A697|nr:DUF2971 domain-containing protein [Cyclobacterium salsum]